MVAILNELTELPGNNNRLANTYLQYSRVTWLI